MSRNWIIAIFALLLLSGCSGERCIEADDFGHANFRVPARYPEELLRSQPFADQVFPWYNSDYRVNGRPLLITVRNWENGLDFNNQDEVSAWCAWYGKKSDGPKLATICKRFRECQFVDGDMCTKTRDARIFNAPCLFKRGVGLYALIAEPFVSPNRSLEDQKNPEGINFHLGDALDGYSLFDVNKRGQTVPAGGMLYTYKSDEEKRKYVNSPLYFKILDKYYTDNSGQYRVVVKSGIHRTSPDPITYVTNLVKEFLFGVNSDKGLIRNIYLGVVQNPGYRSAVAAMLTLYIMFTGLSYLAGNVQLTHTELIMRIGKIAIVSALLSAEYSWSFFNDYLFVYFIGGVEQILQMIINAGATGPGSPSILALMIAPQTLSKLFSLMFVDWLGFVYILLFIIALYFVLVIFFEAAVIYLTALIAIGMIIIMGPIFICFMLFGITRSLFENWLRQLTSYAIQPIILFTGLIFISMILRQEIYGALGFKVCKHSFPKMTDDSGAPLFGDNTEETLGFSLNSSIFYWWFPKPMNGGFIPEGVEPVDIPIPIDHFESADSDVIGTISDTGFCEAYGCIGKRYVDLPFLDPVKDARRLSQFRSGQLVQLDGMLLIFVALYLLSKFNKLAISVAKFLTNTSGNLTDIEKSSNAIMDQTVREFNRRAPGAMKRGALGIVDTAIGKVSGAGGRKEGRELRQGMTAMAKEKMSQYAPGALMDKARIAGLKKDALSSNANKAVLSEVQKKSGLKQGDIDKNAISKYKGELDDRLKKIDSKLSDKERGKLAAKMSKKNYAQLKEEFAKAKYGKEYKKLSAIEKAEIDKLHGDKKLRLNAKEASKARKFQNAYVDAYAGMSDRGIGIAGKHSSAIRSLEEIKHRRDEDKYRKNRKRKLQDEGLVSGYQGLKSSLYHGATGSKRDIASRNFGGGAWHEINTDRNARNFQKQTYAEMLASEKNHMQRTGIGRTIEDLSRRQGANVTSPEFLAQAERNNDPSLSQYRGLERAELNHKVEDALSAGADPALMGDTYMSNYAKDSEMRHMVDKAYEVEQSIIAEDNFIGRQEEYQETFEMAADNIHSTYGTLSEHYNREDIAADEMPGLLSDYYGQNAGMNQDEAMAKVEELQQSINDFHSSQEVLQQIDQRKMEIDQEVENHISGINEHRVNAGMEEYHPEHEKPQTRRVRKIDDYMRK
ncbi:type IV secretion system protein [Rickettsiaceae bacterium]|nr:type IV secretion system protein [Rickettsiaceae bacterium]